MTIRQYRAGDEATQAAIYNAVTGALPGHKPASADDLRRRIQSPRFDPSLWHYAEENGEVVGYCLTQTDGRIGFPWCKPGYEKHAEPLFSAGLAALQARKLPRAYAAYAASWLAQAEFFQARGFSRARDMVNFTQDLTNLPTLLTQPSNPATPMKPTDVGAIYAMAPELWPYRTAEDLRRAWFDDPETPAETLFVIRSRADQQPLAAARLIDNDDYPDATRIDATQPCFRLGAFGTEGSTHKRINGMFSIVTPRARSAMGTALDLLAYAAAKFTGPKANAFAAQVPSDVPHLLTFYQSHFRRQGSFPVFEMSLGS